MRWFIIVVLGGFGVGGSIGDGILLLWGLGEGVVGWLVFVWFFIFYKV